MAAVITIGFHDVVARLQLARPIARGHTTLYTIDGGQFGAHLAAIHARMGPTSVQTLQTLHSVPGPCVLLTFDDGAVGDYEIAAPLLESFGWRAHFFFTTDWVGRPGFVSKAQIRNLHERGHVIGSHSLNHPRQMASLSFREIVRQWSESCDALGSIIGRPVTVASVPGGSFSTDVARAAMVAGINTLFTSRPTVATTSINGCLVRGRYVVRRCTSSATVAAIAACSPGPRYGQALLWAASRVAQRISGPVYPLLRQSISLAMHRSLELSVPSGEENHEVLPRTHS